MARYRTVAAAALVLLAGCSGVTLPSSADGTCGDTAFVLGSQENRLDEFERLTVTVTRVELKRESASSGRKKVVRDVPDQRLDLVRLQGRNLTLLENVSVPNGTYKKVFLSVAEVNGTLKNGTAADVAVRRDRLKVKKQFEVRGNDSLRFTVSPTVVRQDGRYVVRSRIGGSGCSCC